MFMTEQEVRELSSFDEVKALSDVQMKSYIDRADSWIRRATNSPAIDSSVDENLRKDMRIATWLLVEYLLYWDDPETKEALLSQDDNVRIGSYGYSIKPSDGSFLTGVRELDDILKSWTYTWNIGNYFKVSGPTRK